MIYKPLSLKYEYDIKDIEQYCPPNCGGGAGGSKVAKTKKITSKLAKSYGIAEKDVADFNRLMGQGRIAMRKEDVGLSMTGRKFAEKSVGINDLITPTSGPFQGMPLMVKGWSFSKEAPVKWVNPRGQLGGIGSIPTGKLATYEVTPVYHKNDKHTGGTSPDVGIRFHLPIGEWK